MSQIPPHQPYQPQPNPYGQPQPGYQQPPRGYGHRPSPTAITAAGITLIIISLINMGHAVFSYINNLGKEFEVPPNAQNRPDLQWMVDFMSENHEMINLVVPLAFLVLSLLVLIGGICMTQQKMYGFALIAAIIAIIPCNGIMDCCLVEVGVGVWALTLLCLATTKSLFR